MDKDTDKQQDIDNIEDKKDNEDAESAATDAGEGQDGGTSAHDDLHDVVVSQKEQIELLLESQKGLQKQIETLIRNGAKISDDNRDVVDDGADETKGEDYVSLSDLGRDIGKREY